MVKKENQSWYNKQHIVYSFVAVSIIVIIVALFWLGKGGVSAGQGVSVCTGTCALGIPTCSGSCPGGLQALWHAIACRQRRQPAHFQFTAQSG